MILDTHNEWKTIETLIFLYKILFKVVFEIKYYKKIINFAVFTIFWKFLNSAFIMFLDLIAIDH